jgi:hypothetical protein
MTADLIEELSALGADHRLHVSGVDSGDIRLERGAQAVIVHSVGSGYEVSVGARDHIGSPITFIPSAFRELSNIEALKAYLIHIAQEMHA